MGLNSMGLNGFGLNAPPLGAYIRTNLDHSSLSENPAKQVVLPEKVWVLETVMLMSVGFSTKENRCRG
jgi:hypothetical protein